MKSINKTFKPINKCRLNDKCRPQMQKKNRLRSPKTGHLNAPFYNFIQVYIGNRYLVHPDKKPTNDSYFSLEKDKLQKYKNKDIN